MTFYYAGIGSRATPDHIQSEMTEFATYAANFGAILRSGGAVGADSAFEKGVLWDSHKEIYLPWPGFNNCHGSYTYVMYRDFSDEVMKDAQHLAIRFHPAPGRLPPAVMKLMIRNGFQLFGQDFITPSSFVVCWTPDGTANGGTGQAIRIAAVYDIPVFNLFHMDALTAAYQYLENLS